MTTKEEIRGWLEEGKKQGATHVIVMCDTFSYEDYPVFVQPGENARSKAPVGNMQTIMECYSLELPLEEQLSQRRARNWT